MQGIQVYQKENCEWILQFSLKLYVKGKLGMTNIPMMQLNIWILEIQQLILLIDILQFAYFNFMKTINENYDIAIIVPHTQMYINGWCSHHLIVQKRIRLYLY